MRRTLFVVPRDILPAVQAGASARVADAERRRLVRDVEKAGWDGRIVGGWHQSPSGEVVVDPLEAIGDHARARLEQEAGRLTDWLGDIRVAPRFPSPLSR